MVYAKCYACNKYNLLDDNLNYCIVELLGKNKWKMIKYITTKDSSYNGRIFGKRKNGTETGSGCRESFREHAKKITKSEAMAEVL